MAQAPLSRATDNYHEFWRRRGSGVLISFDSVANSVLDTPSYFWLGSSSVPTLPRARPSSASTSLNASSPCQLAMIIIAKADDDNVVLELRETNNTLARLIAIRRRPRRDNDDLTHGGRRSASLTVTSTRLRIKEADRIGPTTTNFYCRPTASSTATIR